MLLSGRFQCVTGVGLERIGCMSTGTGLVADGLHVRALESNY
jgi:hypothetical protein